MARFWHGFLPRLLQAPTNLLGLLVACLMGLLASLALPPHGFIFAVFCLSVPAIGLCYAENWREAFLIGWATGFGWFIYSLFWVSNAFITSGGGHVFLVPFSALGLPLGLGLFWGVAFALAGFAPAGVVRLVWLALCLAVMEYIRGFILTGWPWNSPGMVLAAWDMTLAVVSVIGMWGGGLLVLFIGLAPAMLWMQRGQGKSAVMPLGSVVLLVAGVWLLSLAPQVNESKELTVRLVQPNIEQTEKWLWRSRAKHLEAMILASRAESGAESETPLDLIVWPETAFAGLYEKERGRVHETAFAASGGGGGGGASKAAVPVMLGILSNPEEGVFYNSALLFTPDAASATASASDMTLATYHKRHLVPFGEYAPLRRFFPFIEALAGPNDFSVGTRDVLLSSAWSVQNQQGESVKILPLICYEIIFPREVRRDVEDSSADVIINVTNDGWFGDTIGPRQHLALAQLRAAELGVPVVRVANTGISAVIDGSGVITHRLDYGEEGFIDASVGGGGATIYAKSGDWGFFAMLVFFALIGLKPLLTRAYPKL